MTDKAKFDTREQWLRTFMVRAIEEKPEHLGSVDPDKVRIGVGFVSGGTRSKKVVGQCFTNDETVSGDNVSEIIIDIRHHEARDVASTLVHELGHVVAGIEAKHGAKFAAVMLPLGLKRPMKSTPATDEFWEWVNPILKELGSYPHDRFSPKGTKKQATRLLKCECDTCGFIFRSTAKWVDNLAGGDLRCPNKNCDGTVFVA